MFISLSCKFEWGNKFIDTLSNCRRDISCCRFCAAIVFSFRVLREACMRVRVFSIAGTSVGSIDSKPPFKLVRLSDTVPNVFENNSSTLKSEIVLATLPFRRSMSPKKSSMRRLNLSMTFRIRSSTMVALARG